MNITQKKYPILCLLTSFVVFGWMVFGSHTIGADYTWMHLDTALNLRFYTALGIEPMWAMHVSGGIPFYGLVEAQAYNPLAWILSKFPSFYTGGALILISFKNILLLAGAQFGILCAIRKLSQLDFLTSYLLSFVTIYNAAMLGAFQDAPSIDAAVYTELLIICSILFVQSGQRYLVFLVGLFVQLLLTSGYPPTFPFTPLVGVLCFALFFFYWKSSFLESKKRLLILIGACFIGVLLSAPNWLPFTEWLQVNYKRMLHSDLEWANFNPLDQVKLATNFVRPWAAEIHSAFAGSTLLGLVLAVICIELVKSPRRYWFLALVVLFPFCYAMGPQSSVYLFFFKHVPLFSNIRGAGRFLVFMPFLLMMSLLALVRDQKVKTRTFQIAGLANLLLLLYSFRLQMIYPLGGWKGLGNYEWSPERLTHFWDMPEKLVWLALGTVACLCFLRIKSSWSRPLLVAVTVLQTIMVLQNGTFVRVHPTALTIKDMQAANFLPLYSTLNASVALNDLSEGTNGAATVAYTHFYNAAKNALNCFYPIDREAAESSPAGVVLPFYLSSNVSCASDLEQVFTLLRTEKCDVHQVTHVILSDADCIETPLSLRKNRFLVSLNQENKILTLTPNRIEVKVIGDRDSVFVTSIPFTNDSWKGFLDNRPVPLEKVNGELIGLKVPQGEHIVGIQYFSKRVVASWRLFLIGVVLSLLALMFFRVEKGRMEKVTYWLAIFSVLIAYPFVESHLIQKAEVKILLNQNYTALLHEQLIRWNSR